MLDNSMAGRGLRVRSCVTASLIVHEDDVLTAASGKVEQASMILISRDE